MHEPMMGANYVLGQLAQVGFSLRMFGSTHGQKQLGAFPSPNHNGCFGYRFREFPS